VHLHLLFKGEIEEGSRDALDLLDEVWLDPMADDDIEADLAASAVELIGNATPAK